MNIKPYCNCTASVSLEVKNISYSVKYWHRYFKQLRALDSDLVN